MKTMDFEKQQIIEAFEILKEENLTNPDIGSYVFDKDIEKSSDIRLKGNQLFGKKYHDKEVHEEIWKLYTISIAFAPPESEVLAAAFANRSALLLDLRKYKFALADIERALKITQSSALKVKLFCRQAECFVALQEGKPNSSLEKAKYWLNKVKDRCEIIKLNKTVKKAEKILEDNVPDSSKKEKQNSLNCKNDAVTICYNQKYGRGLIVTRDIEPGELVYIEKFYAASVRKSKLHAYCSHCLAISWTLIPCDYCIRCLYCNEKCKTEAWQKYHDIECLLRNYINIQDDHVVSFVAELSIRSFIMAIREAGSIEKLKDLVTEIDNCKEAKIKGFPEDGQFSSNSFKSLYSLKNSKNTLRIMIDRNIAVAIIQCLVKFTKIFGKNIQFGNGENLMQHEDILFSACLLLRLMSKIHLNAFNVQSTAKSCKFTGDLAKCLQSKCCARGMSISLFTSLINHNCDNNVDKFYTNDGKVVYYATKPIKRNSQIFSSYYCCYTSNDLNVRQALLLDMFEFHCDCLACQQNWPDALNSLQDVRQFKLPKYSEVTIGLIHKNVPLITSLKKSRYVSRKEIQSLARDITIVNNEKTQKPNLATSCFHWTFIIMMTKRYFDKLKIPSTCRSITEY